MQKLFLLASEQLNAKLFDARYADGMAKVVFEYGNVVIIY